MGLRLRSLAPSTSWVAGRRRLNVSPIDHHIEGLKTSSIVAGMAEECLGGQREASENEESELTLECMK